VREKDEKREAERVSERGRDSREETREDSRPEAEPPSYASSSPSVVLASPAAIGALPPTLVREVEVELFKFNPPNPPVIPCLAAIGSTCKLLDTGW
jgi:hypothetical protein